MRTGPRVTLTLALTLSASSALAQNQGASAGSAARPATTATTATTAQATAASPGSAGRPAREVTPFQAALNRGAEAYRRREWDAAATAFREATGLNAQSPLPALYQGYVARARGDLASAQGNFREAQRIALAVGDDGVRGRVLAALAEFQESGNHWDEARGAWQEYTTFSDSHASVTYPAVGRARVEAIGRRATLAQQYEPVRQRIAERQRINAQGGQAPEGMERVPATTTSPGSTPALPPSAIPPRR